MSSAQQIEQDLRFVRDAVTRRNENQMIPLSMALIWGIYVIVGYALMDYSINVAGIFFAAGGVVGGILSGFAGSRLKSEAGEFDRAEARKHALHWGSIVFAVFGVLALAISRGMRGEIIGQYVAFMIGIIYFLAGVHFDRNFLWIGPLLSLGSIAISFVPRYGWTALGLMVGLSLILPPLFAGKRR